MVLPLTREWIEIVNFGMKYLSIRFSLLRGSGLKFSVDLDVAANYIVLPLTREWIEMFTSLTTLTRYGTFSLLRGSGLKYNGGNKARCFNRFSLLRGSGLKCDVLLNLEELLVFSLLRGSGLKWAWQYCFVVCNSVLPLTREWIEMWVVRINVVSSSLFSLLRGSGLKCCSYCGKAVVTDGSPSYEGVD